MSIRLYGQWRLSLTEAVHNWENRFAIQGAASGSGTYPPTVGSVVTASGGSWVLDAQHRPPGEDWRSSPMIFQPAVPETVAVQAVVGAEDPLPTEDYRDIRWTATFLGASMIAVPYRPYGVRPSDLFQLPDGVFEASLGVHLMGLRVTNSWGLPFTDDHTIEISTSGRASLDAGGISVIDGWTAAEQASLGQRIIGTGVSLAGLRPGESRTVYFKLDVTHAAPRKHTLEFICTNRQGMADPGHPARRVSKHIYVSRAWFDRNTSQYVYEADQGTMRIKLHEVLYDQTGYRRNRERLRKAVGGSRDCKKDLERARALMRAFLDGKRVDLCEIQRILACCCIDEEGTRRPAYEPFYALPTRFDATFEPSPPFAGQHGPLLYDDPWWKLALAILAFLLWLAGTLEEGGQSAYEDEDFVIGTLFTSQQHDLDAALCEIDTSRGLSFNTVLDAQSDEDNQVPQEGGVGGNVGGVGPGFMDEAEIQALLDAASQSGNTNGLKVFKSGARTGLTFAEITRFSPPWTRDDDGTRFEDPNQRTIEFTDPGGAEVSNKGDSGSVWVHVDTGRIVALNHSGNDTTAFATVMSHVVNRFGITF
jgi:hypothetical protein